MTLNVTGELPKLRALQQHFASQLAFRSNFSRPILPATFPALFYDDKEQRFCFAQRTERAKLTDDSLWQEIGADKKLYEIGDPVPDLLAQELILRAYDQAADTLDQIIREAREDFAIFQTEMSDSHREAAVRQIEILALDFQMFQREAAWWRERFAAGQPFDAADIWMLQPWRIGGDAAGNNYYRGCGVPWTQSDTAFGPPLKADRVAALIETWSSLQGRQQLSDFEALNFAFSRLPDPLAYRAVPRPAVWTSARPSADDQPRPDLSPQHREALFGRSAIVAGSAGDPAVYNPAGSVLILIDDEPAYRRGCGVEILADGRMRRPELAKALPFVAAPELVAAAHLALAADVEALAARRDLGTPKPAQPFYSAGFRWWREPFSAVLIDETESESDVRAWRSFQSLLQPVLAGIDADKLMLHDHPLRDGQHDFWGMRGPGRHPDRIRDFIYAVTPRFWPQDYIHKAAGEPGLAIADLAFERHAMEHGLYRAAPATWLREWDDALMHDLRWLADVLPRTFLERPELDAFFGRKPAVASVSDADRHAAEAALRAALTAALATEPAPQAAAIKTALHALRQPEAAAIAAWRADIERDRLARIEAYCDWMRAKKARIAHLRHVRDRLDPHIEAWTPEAFASVDMARAPDQIALADAPRFRFENAISRQGESRKDLFVYDGPGMARSRESFAYASSKAKLRDQP